MGVVYRADDLKLGHPIALKFIPHELTDDSARLNYLYAEVRNARQVAHPNVCRVYDIGEHEGRHFLSMEYVDGEDLASLLKRIGRLPVQKAQDLSLQICTGLGAAHNINIVHRDLKPANIMIDSNGQARIMDFGLSFKLGKKDRIGERAGTLAYMAPEHWAGRGANIKSDIYALGLVLYELWSGRHPFEAKSAEELRRKQQEETPRPLSALVPGIDPGIERMILRCLSRDPDSRPSSALEAAAALPGENPVKAAIAAGQTPSPEMIAAAGKKGSLKPGKAWGLLGIILILSTLAVFLSPRSVLMGTPAFEKSPDVLAEQARSIIAEAGYTKPPRDRAYWFEADEGMIDWLSARPPLNPLKISDSSEFHLQTRVVRFRYRESPRALVPNGNQGFIQDTNPARNEPGMADLDLDPQGRLIRFAALPEFQEANTDSGSLGWSRFFSVAGFDLQSWSPSVPGIIPSVPFDRLEAWEKEVGESGGIRLQILAASYKNLPVYFEVLGPWRQHQLKGADFWTWKILPAVWFGAVLLILVFGIYFANRNIRRGRGDTRRAFRIAIFGFLTLAAGGILWSHHAYSSAGDFMWWIRGSVAFFLFDALFIWIVYVAAEPAIRRFLPDGMVSWNRLLGGRMRDPLVGRDLLTGAVFGTALASIMFALRALPGWTSLPGIWSTHIELQSLLGFPHQIGMAVYLLGMTGFYCIGWIAAFVLASFIFKKKWIVFLNFVIFGEVNAMVGMGGNLRMQAIFALISSLFVIAILFRYGFLSAAAAFFFFSLLVRMPLRIDLKYWPAREAMTTLAVVCFFVLYGFFVSLGKQSPFGQIKDE